MNCLICLKEIKCYRKFCSNVCRNKANLGNKARIEKYASTFEERFWKRVDKSGNCWLWTGGISSEGYGDVKRNKKSLLTHREAYRLTYGELKDDICVLHRCDNPPCVNPSHLFTGDRALNNLDKVQKGRQPSHKGSKNPNCKINQKQAAEIISLYKTGKYKQIDLAAMYGVNQPHISRIIRGEAWNEIDTFT